MHLRIRIDFLSRHLKTVFPLVNRGNSKLATKNRGASKKEEAVCVIRSASKCSSRAQIKSYPFATEVSFSHLFTILITNLLLAVYEAERNCGREGSSIERERKSGLAKV